MTEREGGKWDFFSIFLCVIQIDKNGTHNHSPSFLANSNSTVLRFHTSTGNPFIFFFALSLLHILARKKKYTRNKEKGFSGAFCWCGGDDDVEVLRCWVSRRTVGRALMGLDLTVDLRRTVLRTRPLYYRGTSATNCTPTHEVAHHPPHAQRRGVRRGVTPSGRPLLAGRRAQTTPPQEGRPHPHAVARPPLGHCLTTHTDEATHSTATVSQHRRLPGETTTLGTMG